MSELTEMNPTFKKCMVKKSKYYFKEIWGFILVSFLIVIACILIAVGVFWVADNVTSSVIMGFLVYLITVLTAAFVFSLPNITIVRFLKSIVDVHLICIAIICACIVIVSCYASLSIGVSTILAFYLQTIYTFPVVGYMGLWAVMFAILCPINFALGDCLKCQIYTQLLFDKILSYELV